MIWERQRNYLNKYQERPRQYLVISPWSVTPNIHTKLQLPHNMRALCCKWQIVVFQGWNLSLPALCTFFVFKHNAQSTNCTCTLPKPKESAKDEEMVDVGWFLLGIWWIRFVIPEIGYFWVSIWIHICQKITPKNKETSCSTNQHLLPFPDWFRVPEKENNFG